MRSKVSSDWLPTYIKATRPVLWILTDSPRKSPCLATLLLDPEEEGITFLWNSKYPNTHISLNTWIFILVIFTLDESTLEQAVTFCWSINECL
jgi:hypothetical protein